MHIDENGAKMTDAQLRTLEEQYVLHKVCVVIDVPMLLAIDDGAAAWSMFPDGSTRAYNNMVAVPKRLVVNSLGGVSVVVECSDGPEGCNYVVNGWLKSGVLKPDFRTFTMVIDGLAA